MSGDLINQPELYESSKINELKKDRIRNIDPNTKTNKELNAHEYKGTAFEDLGIITNNRGLPITLNDGSLIYNN